MPGASLENVFKGNDEGRSGKKASKCNNEESVRRVKRAANRGRNYLRKNVLIQIEEGGFCGKILYFKSMKEASVEKCFNSNRRRRLLWKNVLIQIEEGRLFVEYYKETETGNFRGKYFKDTDERNTRIPSQR